MGMNLLCFVVLICHVYNSFSKPNFIVMQPDDLLWLEEWDPVPHFDPPGMVVTVPDVSLIPNIERLRLNGIQMKQAYTASAVCGTSRYSTITGRYPSRSSYGRNINFNDTMRDVTIATTKLEDIDKVEDGNDCSVGNLANVMKNDLYKTGMVGKWHLLNIRKGSSGGGGTKKGGVGKKTKQDEKGERNRVRKKGRRGRLLQENTESEFNYTLVQETIRSCGFDFAEAIYPENMGGSWVQSFANITIDHNMEHVTSKALEFIDIALGNNDPKPFFLYINPTVPHGSGNVYDVLSEYDCRDTVDGKLSDPPHIGFGRMKTDSSDPDCRKYRQTVLDRANSTENKELGMIWIDDGIGSIIEQLESYGELDNTFFLFQMDHGQEGKHTLFETGNRIAQFIHYPDYLGTEGKSFEGLVSTIDIGPTIFDFAGIDSGSHYQLGMLG